MTEWSYLSGLQEGTERQYQKDRIAAFGALRRAAQEARMCDKHKQYTTALAVRDAIRAAMEPEEV